ncbi:MAG TPA: lipocalin family protein [Paracoccaceae bacterium]|nr:lipocalin family protein [Paracoccaceae bacterium]
MLRLVSLALAAMIALTPSAQAEVYRDKSVPMQTVSGFDLGRYLGLWYEIARYPFSFENGCAGVTAEYSMKADGKVRVVNSCYEGAVDGPLRVSEGTAELVGDGKLEVGFVSFLPFITGDYWVIHLEPDYSMAVVGSPAGKTGWILSRTKQISQAKFDRATAALTANGYDLSALEIVAQ